MIVPKEIQEIIDYIEDNGFEVYIVGGAVRDFLLDKKPLDFDLTTNALPGDLKKIFKNKNDIRIFEVGIKHGTLTICNKNYCMEITTYRTEEEYRDLRHPDKVSFVTNIDEDLKRRDFTINAICYRNGIYDPFNGQKDLKNKVIRAIGNPDQRFNEDALRIMRAIRFAAILGFEIEKQTRQSIFNNKNLLEKISIERIRDEFDKILMSNNASNIILLYYDIFYYFFKDFGTVYNVNLNFNILNLASKNFLLRLSSFYYIIIKNTLPFVDNFDYKFYIKKTLKNLNYPFETILKTTTILNNLDIKLINNKIFIKNKINKLGLENLINLLNFKIIIRKYVKEDYSNISNMLDTIEEIINNNEVFSLKQLNINGKDLVDLGVKEGPEIGNILQKILKLIINEQLINEKKLIIEFINNKIIGK